MKQIKSGLWIAVVIGFVLNATMVLAEGTPTLTRAQWLKKIGVSVTDGTVLRETLSQIAPGDVKEFTSRMMKAVSRMPVSPEEKTAAFVRAAVACIAGAKGDMKELVIAEVFAGVPIEYLPVVADELAKRFNQTHNKLSNEAYNSIVLETLKVVFERTAQTDSPSVRNAFAMAAFLLGANDTTLKDKVIASLPDQRMRDLVASWMPGILQNHNYEPLLAAADVENLGLRREVLLPLVGHANLDRLLADLNANSAFHADGEVSAWVPLSQVTGVNGTGLSSVYALRGMSVFAQNTGMNRVPQGYQNQGTSVVDPTQHTR